MKTERNPKETIHIWMFSCSRKKTKKNNDQEKKKVKEKISPTWRQITYKLATKVA